jgi:hypothetical protein
MPMRLPNRPLRIGIMDVRQEKDIDAITSPCVYECALRFPVNTFSSDNIKKCCPDNSAGFWPEILHWLFHIANVNYESVTFTNWGEDFPTSLSSPPPTSGYLGALYNGTIDVGTVTYVVTTDIAKHFFDVSTSILRSDTVVIARTTEPNLIESQLRLFDMFHIGVWLFVLGAFIIATCGILIEHRINRVDGEWYQHIFCVMYRLVGEMCIECAS